VIKLILTDMDGTFLNSTGDFNRPLFEEIRQLLEQQEIHFAPVSGKQCERIEELFATDASSMWIVGDSATRIKRQGEFVYQSLLPNQLGQRLINRLEMLSDVHTIIACTPDGAFVKDTISPEEFEIVRGSYRKVTSIARLQELNEDFVKITVHDPALQCFETIKQLNEFQEDAYLVASEAGWIDIANVDVHKGTTVEHLQRILEVSPEETMAFGDGYNDLELFERAHYSYAVANAVPELKASAHTIIETNDADSVLKTIREVVQAKGQTS